MAKVSELESRAAAAPEPVRCPASCMAEWLMTNSSSHAWNDGVTLHVSISAPLKVALRCEG